MNDTFRRSTRAALLKAGIAIRGQVADQYRDKLHEIPTIPSRPFLHEGRAFISVDNKAVPIVPAVTLRKDEWIALDPVVTRAILDSVRRRPFIYESVTSRLDTFELRYRPDLKQWALEYASRSGLFYTSTKGGPPYRADL